jgi:hypothetical protein
MIACMADVRSAIKDMVRQRRVQAATGALAFVGLALWLVGIPLGEYLAAGAIIVFAIATIRWVDDEEVVEEEQLQQINVKK